MKKNFKNRRNHLIRKLEVSKTFLIAMIAFTIFPKLSNAQNCYCDQLGAIIIGSEVNIETVSEAVNLGKLPSYQTPQSPIVKVCVKGDLVVDQDYNFGYAELYMHTDAHMQVESDNMLTFNNTLVEGCKNMWGFIEVQEDATAKIFSSNIKDGKEAFLIRDGSNVLFQNNNFVNNYYGINIEHTSSTGPKAVINVIDAFIGNDFQTVGDLKPPFDEEIGYAGINVYRTIGFNVGTFKNGIATNLFEDLRYGIIVDDSPVSVYHATFLDITNTEIDTEDGDAIVLKNGAAGEFKHNSFDECRYGMNIFQPRDLAITENTFSDIRYRAILYDGGTNAFSADAIFNENTIETESDGTWRTTGIFLTRLALNSKGELLDNEVKVGSNTSGWAEWSGITFSGIFFPEDFTFPIRNNQVDVRLADGLDIGGVWTGKVVVEDNTISILQPPSGSAVVGYFITGLDVGTIFSAGNVTGNVVTGFSDSDIGTIRGLQSSQNGGVVTFCCNTIDDTERGIEFFGIHGGVFSFAQNDIGDHEFGVYLTENAMIGPQEHNGNLWNGSYVDADAIHYGASEAAVQASPFVIHTTSSPHYPSTIDLPNAPGATWFSTGSGTPLTCTSYPYCSDELVPDITDFDITVAEGSLYMGTEFESTTKWSAERALYAKLDKDTFLMSQDTILSNFYNNNANTSIGKFHAVDMNIRNLFKSTTTDILSIDTLAGQVWDLLVEVSIIDTSLVDASTQDSSSLVSDRVSKMDSVQYLSTFIDSLTSIADSLLHDEIDSILAQIILLSEDSIYEKNEKVVNRIFLEAVGEQSLTESQIEDLLEIAGQCPSEGGMYVFVARILYALADDSLFIDDIICGDTVIDRNSIGYILEDDTPR